MDKMPTLNVRKYVEAFGGRQQLINKIRQRFAAQLTIKQVDKWVERDSIPGAYLIAMKILGSETDPPIELLDYLDRKTKP